MACCCSTSDLPPLPTSQSTLFSINCYFPIRLAFNRCFGALLRSNRPRGVLIQNTELSSQTWYFRWEGEMMLFWLRQELKESKCLSVCPPVTNCFFFISQALSILHQTDGAKNEFSCFFFPASCAVQSIADIKHGSLSWLHHYSHKMRKTADSSS